MLYSCIICIALYIIIIMNVLHSTYYILNHFSLLYLGSCITATRKMCGKFQILLNRRGYIIDAVRKTFISRRIVILLYSRNRFSGFSNIALGKWNWIYSKPTKLLLRYSEWQKNSILKRNRYKIFLRVLP